MSKLCVIVFFTTTALAAVFSLKGIDVNGALGFAMFFSGIGSVSRLTVIVNAILTPITNKVFGKPKARKGRERVATR